MSNDIGAKIGIEGEKAYKQSLADIGKDLRVLTSEMKLNSAEFDGNANSIQALKNKSEILDKQYSTQKEKVEALRKALENAKTTYGENSNEVKEWQIKLNGAETDLSKLNLRVQNNDKYMNEAKTSTNGMATSIDNFGKEVKIAGEKAKETGDIIQGNLASTATIGAVVGLGVAMAEAGKATVGFTVDSDKALNTLIAKTGATSEEFGALEDSMNDIYENNFGDSIGDVANAMATVKQQTGLANEELEQTTTQAILLKDTFDFEVNESIRSVQMMMTQFGLTSEESFNLIAQGAQNGLDKNGDLLDSINEYSVHFEQLGLDATEMFNMMVNGSKSGTFSVDQLGDTVKEFGIRVKDGSKTTSEAFTSIGLETNEMAKSFLKGGDSAQTALNTTVKKLFELKDPIARNTAGVSLFGTMWENLGETGVESLMNVNGEISTTSDALNKINSQKYDDVGSALVGLGRQIQVSISEPLGETLEPIVDNLMEKIQENAPQIQEAISGITETLGEGIGWFIDNSDLAIAGLTGIGAAMMTSATVGVINEVVVGYKAFTIATEGATSAQSAFNVAQKANVVGLIATAVIGLGTAMVVYGSQQKGATTELGKLNEKIKVTREENKKFMEEIADSESRFFDNTKEVSANYQAVQILSDKLFVLADKEKQTNSEKEQMEILVGQLNKSIPELNLVIDEQTGAINRQQGKVNGLIQSMREKALSQVYEERYLVVAKEQADALDKQKKATDERTTAENQLNIAKAEYLAREKEINEYHGKDNVELANMMSNLGELSNTIQAYQTTYDNANQSVQEHDTMLNGLTDRFDALDEAIGETTESTENQATVTVDSSANIETALAETEDAYKKAKETAIDSIQGQIDIFDKFNGKSKLSTTDLLTNLQSQAEGVSKWAANLDELSKKGIDEGLLQHLKDMGPSAAGEIAALNTLTKEELKPYSKAWVDLGIATEKGVEATIGKMTNAYSKAYVDSKAESYKQGALGTQEYMNGSNSKEEEAKKNMKALLGGIVKDASPDAKEKAKLAGKNIIDGIKAGLDDNESTLFTKITNIGTAILKAFNVSIDAHSPARKFIPSGGHIPEGIAVGIEKKAHLAKEAMNNLSNGLVFGNELNTDFGSMNINSANIPNIGSMGNISTKTSSLVLNFYVQEMDDANIKKVVDIIDIELGILTP